MAKPFMSRKEFYKQLRKELREKGELREEPKEKKIVPKVKPKLKPKRKIEFGKIAKKLLAKPPRPKVTPAKEVVVKVPIPKIPIRLKRGRTYLDAPSLYFKGATGLKKPEKPKRSVFWK